MTQRQLHRVVARATGESLATIARMGFGIVDLSTPPDDDRPTRFGPNIVNWDADIRPIRFDVATPRFSRFRAFVITRG
jgi:hypothetical protein